MFYCYMDLGRHFRLYVILVHSCHFIPEVHSNDWSTGAGGPGPGVKLSENFVKFIVTNVDLTVIDNIDIKVSHF